MGQRWLSPFSCQACLTWRVFPLTPPSLFQVELSIQRGCMTRAWTPSTAFPWLHLWISSSSVYTEDFLQKSRILTISGKYVADLRLLPFFFPMFYFFLAWGRTPVVNILHFKQTLRNAARAQWIFALIKTAWRPGCRAHTNSIIPNGSWVSNQGACVIESTIFKCPIMQ